MREKEIREQHKMVGHVHRGPEKIVAMRSDGVQNHERRRGRPKKICLEKIRNDLKILS